MYEHAIFLQESTIVLQVQRLKIEAILGHDQGLGGQADQIEPSWLGKENFEPQEEPHPTRCFLHVLLSLPLGNPLSN
jgi:hypothetical protein